MIYHQGTERWLVDTGDGSNPDHRHTFTSTNDGQLASWHEWWFELPGTNHSSPAGQVTCFRDANDPQRVYFGSDAHLRAGWLDPSTWRTGTFMERQFVNRGNRDPNWGSPFEWFVWDLSRFQDVWYATLASSDPNYQTPVVLASSDLGRWAVCGRLATDRTSYQTFGYCAGKLGDWLHYIVADEHWNVYHGRARTVQVAEVDGVCVSPVKNNLLTDAESRCSDPDAWAAENGTLTVDPNVQFFPGQASLRVTASGLNSDALVTLRLAVPHTGNMNVPYRFHVWVRGSAKKLHLKVANDSVRRADFALRADPDGNPQWTEIWTPAISYDHEFYLWPRIEISPNEVDRAAEVWLGAAEVAEAPVEGEWVPGGANSPMENFDYQGLAFGAEWTHLFSTVLLSGTDDLGASGRSYIRSYRVSSPGGVRYAELYFDCEQKHFRLAVDGADVLTCAPRTLLGGTRVYFAVRQVGLTAQNRSLHLSISDGAGVEHVSVSVGTALSGLGGSIRSGNNAGDSVAAQVYLEDVFYPACALSDGEVEQRFSQPTLKE